MVGFYWYTPVDLAPDLSSGALLTHYGSPVITRHNTVLVPLRVGPTTFRVQGRVGATGDLLWQLTSDYIPPPHRWTPSFNPVLTPTGRMVMPLVGGRVQVCDNPDSANAAAAVNNLVFYGSNAAYLAAKPAYDAAVFINTPLTSDAAGNIFFGFTVVNIVQGGAGQWRRGAHRRQRRVQFVAAPRSPATPGLVKPRPTARRRCRSTTARCTWCSTRRRRSMAAPAGAWWRSMPPHWR